MDKIKRFFSNQNGLTLMELIVTLAIISIMILVVAEVYVSGMVQSKADMKKAQLQIAGKSSLEGVTRNIKLASKVEATYDVYTTDSTHLILKIPAIDSSENFIYSGGARVNDYIVYYLDGKNLHKVIDAPNVSSRLHSQDGSDDILLNNVKSINFGYDMPAPNTVLVNINITVEDISQKVPIELNLNANGRLRNVQEG